MKRQLMRLWKAVAFTFRKRAFLIRLLCTTLLAVTIPLTFMSFQLVNRESTHLKQTIQDQLKSVTASVANRFDDYISRMLDVNTKLMISSKLSENVLSSGTQAQLDALEEIKYYHFAIPFVTNYALFFPSTNEAYTLAGKMQTNGLARFALYISPEYFAQLLKDFSNAAGFAAWDTTSNHSLFFAPIRPGSLCEPTRYSIYIFTSSSLQENLNAELSSEYRIACIRNAEGTVIFRNQAISDEELLAEDSKWITCVQSGSRGYSVQVCADESALQRNVERISANAQRISIINICLCIVLILMAVVLNYRPLAKVVHRIQGTDVAETAPELDTILSSYTALLNEKGALTYQLYESNMLIVDHVMDNLLSGRRIQPDDQRLLKLNMPCYRIVCAALDQVHCTSKIISRNVVGAPIYALEMYADNRLAFVCGSADDSSKSLQLLQETLRKLIESDEIPLGYSTVYKTPERLFLAYLEAGKALLADSDKPDHFAFDLREHRMFILEDDPQKVEELTYAIRTGDEQVIRYAEQSFDEIIDKPVSRSEKRYACYQLIDLYRRLGEAFGMDLDMLLLSQSLQENEIAVLRDRFLDVWGKAYEKLKQNRSETTAQSYSDLLQYIKSNFADPMFDMNQVADHLGVSIYTASRMIKTITGINFRKYLNDMRVEYARDLLLTTDLPVNDIAVKAGFSSSSYFISIFRKTESITPSNFRKQHGDDA